VHTLWKEGVARDTYERSALTGSRTRVKIVVFMFTPSTVNRRVAWQGCPAGPP